MKLTDIVDIDQWLLMRAQQFEDQHAPQNLTAGSRVAAEAITRLRAELAELRDPKLSHMRLENGCLDMALVSPVIEGLATALGGWFVAGGAKNYAEMRLHDRHETGAVYIVTVQKSGAHTPHELRKEAVAEAARLRAEVDRLRAALAEYVCDCKGGCEADASFDIHWKCGDTARAALTTQQKEKNNG